MKKSFLPALCALALPSLAFPGPKQPLIEDPACAVPFYGGVTAGYDSSYLFRGGRYGDEAPWGELDLNLDLSDNLTLNGGIWYINPTRNEIVSDELDLYVYLFFPVQLAALGEWEVGVGGSWFRYIEDDDDGGEVNLILSKSVGELFDFSFEYVYDISFEGHYFGYYADKSIPLTSCLDLDLGAGVSHADENYNFDVLGGDHAYTRAGLTFHLTESAAFSSYVLGNYAFGDLEDAGEESDFYWGASMTVSF